jgi:hypothetical protein
MVSMVANDFLDPVFVVVVDVCNDDFSVGGCSAGGEACVCNQEYT